MTKIDGRDFPENLYYHQDHMWLKHENGTATVGYTDWAQNAAGKLLNINTRKQGKTIKQGKTLGTVESGKWVGPLRSPITGEITEINQDVLKTPATINTDPYGKGWIAKLTPINTDELDTLMKGTDSAKLTDWINEEKEKTK